MSTSSNSIFTKRVAAKWLFAQGNVKTAKGKYDHIDFAPPESVAHAAERGLEYRKKGGGGGLSTEEASKQGIGSGVQRAVNLKNRDTLSPATVRRMSNFFNRHQKNKAIDAKFKGTPWKDRGYVAWLLWGGDSGRSWAAKVVRQMDAADKKKTAKATGSKTGVGESVGLFIPLPKELAKKFPGLGENDDSPSHVTFLYIGDFKNKAEQAELVEKLQEVFRKYWPKVRASLDKLEYFDHPDKDRRVPHVSVKFDKDLSGFKHRVKQELQDAGIEVGDKFPEFKPHVTLAYLPGMDGAWDGPVPEGSWDFDEMEIWGMPELHKIQLGPQPKSVAASWAHCRFVAAINRVFQRPGVKTAGWWAINGQKPPVNKGPLMNAIPGCDPADAAMYTGDGPADHTGGYLDQIDLMYRTVWGRPAHPEELQATFNFSFRSVEDGCAKLNEWFDEFIAWFGVPATKITWSLDVWDKLSWFFLQRRNGPFFPGTELPDIWKTLGVVKDDLKRLNALEYASDTSTGAKFQDAVLAKLDTMRDYWLDTMFPKQLKESEQDLVKRISETWLKGVHAMTTMAQRVAARRLMADGYFSVGDEILFGKYKNKRGKVLRFFDDERGVPSVEIEPVPKGRKQNKTIGLYKIWKTKEERQKQACVIFSKNCDGDVVLGKVRDRMYDPSICVYHLEVDGTEMCVMFDRITGFCEGINEHGLAIVNSSLMVLQDEREGMADGDTDPERSPDGIKIIKALTKRTIPEVLRTLITYKPKKFQRGLKGHTLVSNGKEVYALENTRIHTPKAIKLKPDEVNTRTNHGIYYPGAGYTKGDDYLSSIVRQWESKKQLEKVRRPEDLMPSLTQSIEKTEGDMNPVRFTDKMRTTSQMVADPAKGEMLLYLVPGHSKFEGVRNLLPDGRKPKMKVRVFKYPSKERLKDPYVTVPDELDSASAKKSLRRQVMAQRVATRALQADKLPGGLADKKKPGDFDPKQLAKGTKVELEHTEDRAVAQEVAMDHLTEDKAYYDKLETIEKQGALARHVFGAYSEEFLNTVQSQRFPSPKTGKGVLFKSLPPPEQKKIYDRWRGQKTQDGGDLSLQTVEERGRVFETGRPVEFEYLRNTEKAPGRPSGSDPYQQQIEPAGFYVTHRTTDSDPPPGFETGTVGFENPLVLDLNSGSQDQIYDQNSWKAQLERKYGKRGKALTQALQQEGYDGLVTVQQVRGRPYTSEIVVLDSKSSVKKAMAERVAARYKSKKTVKKQDGGDMTVYEYSDRQVADRNRKKAERIEKLRTSMRKLQTKVRKDVQSKDEKVRDVALAVGLMDETFERVGNPGSAKEGHFGVTTWQVKHIKFGKGGATITYVGKSGVDQNKKLSNPRIVSALKKVCKDKGKDDCVLSVSAADVNMYLKSFGISAKDIRGFHANTEMKTQLKKIRKGKLPKDDKERKEKLKDEFKAALEATAERVGHQASTLKSQYLVPGLEDDYMKDGTVSESHTRKGSLRTAAENGTPTERRILANAVNAPVLVIRDRQWWLREAPSIYRMAREHEKARPSIEGIRFDPQVFSVLWYEDADGNNLGEPKYSNDQPPVEPEGARYQRSQFPNYLRDSILRLNDDGTSTAVMEGNRGFPEDLVTAMVRSEQWDVGDAIMVAAQACSRCMNGLAHHYGLKWGMEIGSKEFLTHNTVCSMCEHHEKVATKSKSEREEEGAETLVRKSPKKKPPRYDLRDHSGVDEEDPDLEGRGGGDKGDRDLSMKWNKVGHRVAWRWRALPESPSAARVALQRMAEAEAPTAPPAGGGGQKAPTFEVWVKEKRWPSKAENAPPGAEVGFEGLKKQDPGRAEKVRAEFKRQFPSVDDEGGDKGKKKDDGGPKERSYEDIDGELEEARNDEDELENTVEELEEQIKASKARILKLRRQKKKPKIDPQARKEEIQKRIDEEKNKMRESASRMKETGKEMDALEEAADTDALKKSVAKAKKQIKHLQGQIETWNADEENPKWAPLFEKLEAEREQLRELKAQAKDDQRELKAKEKEYEAFRSQGLENAKAVKFLENKLQEAENQQALGDPQEQVKEQLKEERKKLDDAEEELKESREDLKAKTKRVNDLKDEREDPTGANQKQDQARKIEKRKRIQEAVKKTTEVMENLMGKGSTVPKVTRQAIEDQLVEMNEEAMEVFALEFENSIKSLTDQDPSSDESVDLANAMALQGYTTKGANTPEELAERVAQITYARNVVANPLIAGGKPVGQTGELSNDGWQARAIDGFNQFQRLDKDLRLQAHNRLEEALKVVEEDSPQAQELEAIRAGMNMAHVADTGEALPGQQQPTKASAALVSKMVETGNAREMLRPTQDMFTPESRKGMRQSLNAMSDKDLVDLVIGDDPDHPFASWKDIMDTPDSTGGEFKQFIKSFLVDDWMNDIWGDRAARDVMEAAGVEGWDDNEARAGISDQAKHNAGPGRQKAMEAGVRIEEAKKDGKRPDPDDMALFEEWFGEGGRGLRENTQSLLDTLKDKFNKWVISPATSVLKHFTETGDKTVFETETVPHADEASPEPRTKEQREQARQDAPTPGERSKAPSDQDRSALIDEFVQSKLDLGMSDEYTETLRKQMEEEFSDPAKYQQWRDHFDKRKEGVPTPDEESKGTVRTLKKKHEKIRDLSDEELDNEAGEYFENAFTQAALPGAFKDVEDLKRRVKEAEVTHLDSDQLASLANSDVGDVLRSDDPAARAQELAKEYGRDLGRVEQGISEGAEMPPAIVLKDKNGQLVLMGGNTRLMGGAAAGASMPVKIIEVDSEFDEKAGEAASQAEGPKAPSDQERSGLVDEFVQHNLDIGMSDEYADTLRKQMEEAFADPQTYQGWREHFDKRKKLMEADPEKFKREEQRMAKRLQRLQKAQDMRQKMREQREKIAPGARAKFDERLKKLEDAIDKTSEDIHDVAQGPGDVWKTLAGNWRAKNKDGSPKSFKDKDKAEQYAKGDRKISPEDDREGDEGFSADFNIPVEDRGPTPTRMATDKVADLWLAKVRSIHPDDPNRPMIVIKAA